MELGCFFLNSRMAFYFPKDVGSAFPPVIAWIWSAPFRPIKCCQIQLVILRSQDFYAQEVDPGGFKSRKAEFFQLAAIQDLARTHWHQAHIYRCNLSPTSFLALKRMLPNRVKHLQKYGRRKTQLSRMPAQFLQRNQSPIYPNQYLYREWDRSVERIQVLPAIR